MNSTVQKFLGASASRLVLTGIFACGALLAALSAQAVVIVAPNSFAAAAGPTGNCIPGTGCLGQDRYQQVFASSQFAALSGPELITQIAFRRDEGSTPSPFSHIFSNLAIRLSTTSAAPDGLSPTFAANQGADITVVRSGALTLSSASSGSVGPQPFDIVIALTTPFLYAPSAGNLLLDWQNIGGESFGFGGVFYDAVFATDSVSRLFAGPSGATTGSADTVGLIAQFSTQPAQAPEPGTVALLGLGLLAFGMRRLRQ